MDRETRRELDRLLSGFAEALDQIRMAADRQSELAGFHMLRTLGFELNEVLAGIDQPRSA